MKAGDQVGASKISSDLKKLVSGEVISPGHLQYDNHRQLFNSFFNKYPHAIVRCHNLSDTLHALEYAILNEIPFCVKAGGHSAAGHSTIDNGIVIDIRPMSQVTIDPLQRKAVVDGGATWLEFDRKAEVFGLATTGGIISNTGVAGLTLGGGLGWLMGSYGIACDNLIAAEVVLANGRVINCSDIENQDLMWALRGGGGNFGIVTKFTFQLHQVTNVIAGTLFFPVERATEVLENYRIITENTPDDVTFDLVLRTMMSGNKVVMIDACWCGDQTAGKQYFDKLIELFKPNRSNIELRKYTEWQQNVDDDLRAGRRSYWRGLYMEHLSDEVIKAIISAFSQVPSHYTMLTFDHVHGKAVTHNPRSCYSRRNYPHVFLINTNWTHIEEDMTNIEWSNDLYKELQSIVGHDHGYVNYLSQEGRSRVLNAFPPETLKRLVQVKKTFDPKNHFSQNANIPPNLDL